MCCQQFLLWQLFGFSLLGMENKMVYGILLCVCLAILFICIPLLSFDCDSCGERRSVIQLGEENGKNIYKCEKCGCEFII